MRYFLSVLLTTCIMAGMMAGCDVFSGGEAGPVTLTGQVINASTRAAVPDAAVRVLPMDELVFTDDQGRYEIEVRIDSTMDVDITVSKSGYLNYTTSVLAVADRTLEVATIELIPSGGGTNTPGTGVSGKASNLLLLNQSASFIGVRESGSEEVAELVFQARDSLGRPITLSNQVTVNFSFGTSPGGGAFIFPESAQTNENGEVRTNISSGTIAGVIQVIAQARVDGRTIRSKPVALAIHGGLPHPDHFGVAPNKFNVARAWDVWGVPGNVTAFVGDQYGNPVRVGTSVYFTATAGIIGGSATTSDDGRASQQIISGPPQPVHAQYGAGYVTVSASTAEDGAEITESTVLLFSGTSRIVVPAGQGAIILGNAYEFYVYDQNENPLAEGTRITVTAEGTNVESFGNNDVLLSDNLFGDHNFAGNTYGITRFTFGAQAGEEVNDQGVLIPSALEALTIRVQSPNGNIERVVLQNGTVLKREEDGRLVSVVE